MVEDIVDSYRTFASGNSAINDEYMVKPLSNLAKHIKSYRQTRF